MTDFRQGILLSNRLFWTNSYPVVAKWFSRRAIPSNSSINCQVYRQCRLFHSNDRRMSDFFTVVDHVVIGDWKWTCIRKYLWVLQETTTERLDQRTCEASRSETEKKMDRKSESLEEWLWVMSYPILFSSPFFSILYLLFLALYCPSEDTASLLLSFHRQWSIIPSLLCLLHHRIDLSLILCDSISISFEARLCSLFSWRRTEGILQEKLELSSIYSLSFSSFRSILFVASFLFWSLIPNTSSLPSNLFRSSFFSWTST